MEVEWGKCEQAPSGWCYLRDASTIKCIGAVYVIFKASGKKSIIYVGQTFGLRARLQAHRRRFKAYGPTTNPLRVTWAFLDGQLLDGVERYLIDTLQPKEGSKGHPAASPIKVNLPW